MKKYILLLPVLFIVFSECNLNDTERQKVKIENDNLSLEINLTGGAITSLSLPDRGVNFLNWRLTMEEMPVNNRAGAPFEGHFLCYGRWGAPTEGEIRAGIPHNGDHNNLQWNYQLSDNKRELFMEVESDMENARITRQVRLDKSDAIFQILEKFEHTSAIGRLSNIVQHITLGPPFLSDSIRIFSNCTYGFLQENCWPDPYEHAYKWPIGITPEGLEIDLRKFNAEKNFVSTHIFEDSIGWVIAMDPLTDSFLGYLWKTSDYPWINFWNQNRDGKPWAYGLEFGTTGIGRSYQDLISGKTTFHDHPSFYFADAGETLEKSYFGFAGKIPPGFHFTENIMIDTFITISFKSENANQSKSVRYDLRNITGN